MKNMKLKEKKCVPCEGGVNPMTVEMVSEYLTEISGDWEADRNRSIKRDFSFKDFKSGMDFANRVAAIAEEEGHHPDLHIYYSHVRVELSTHAIGGLSENDFILAAKIDDLTQ